MERRMKERVTYSDIDAAGREANASEEAEGGAVCVIERDEVVEVGDVDVLVIQEHAVWVSAFLVGHGLRVYVMPSTQSQFSSSAQQHHTN